MVCAKIIPLTGFILAYTVTGAPQACHRIIIVYGMSICTKNTLIARAVLIFVQTDRHRSEGVFVVDTCGL